MRLPPSDIQILLPVWGERYTRDFLDFSLPSLMAPGNLPGISRLGRCTFVLLAPVKDVETIVRSSLWALLLDCCSVRVKYIDDLISQSSSTVLTLAYTLAIREAGERALDTCFIPLVADYILSDGSLLAVVERVFAGASGVLAGNFQVAREIAFPCLEKSKNSAGILAIPPRELVELSLGALHQTTLTEIVNESQAVSPATNRIFWRVDDHCLVGRFFLMHMIAIRPETLDFIIAAPSDYSLIPELCPSGKIIRMTDSDDYFVVECQPRSSGTQETATLRIEPRQFAKALADWATATHRDNAKHVLVFHAGVPPPYLAEAIAASDAFVTEVEANSAASSMPFRDHPLWRRALDYHLTTAKMEPDLSRLGAITGDISLEGRRDVASRLRLALLGRAPYFRPWHPRWADVRMLKLSLAAASGNVAVVSDASARVRAWLDKVAIERGGRSTIHIRLGDLPHEASTHAKRVGSQFDCLLFISDQASSGLADTVLRLASLVRPDGAIILAIGRFFFETEYQLTSVFVPGDLVLTDGNLPIERTACVTASAWRIAIQTAMMQYARKSTRPTDFRTLFWVVAAGGLAAISMFSNIAAVMRRKPSKRARFSSVIFKSSKAES